MTTSPYKGNVNYGLPTKHRKLNNKQTVDGDREDLDTSMEMAADARVLKK